MTADFGPARAIDAQSFGDPGQRTFRLRIIGADGQTAALWLEKQQLQAFDLAFGQMLLQGGYDGEPPAVDLGEFPNEPHVDFRAGRIALGFDPADRAVVIHAFDSPEEDETTPTLVFRLTQEQCASLVPKIREIVARGRPICPLCGQGIDPTGHTCVRSNGHSSQPIPDQGGQQEP